MAVLALLNPLDTDTDERVAIRVCSSAADREVTGADDAEWVPAVSRAPSIGIDLFDGDFTSPVRPAAGQMTLRLDVIEEFYGQRSLNWADTPVSIWHWRDGAAEQALNARVDQFAVEDMAVVLRLKVDDEPFEAKVLAEEYAGTTGIEGGADLKGRPKPWVFGRVRNVEPVLIDAIDNVYQVSAYGPVQAITAVYERGASFGASQGDYADYDALVAASLDEGQWASAKAQGLLRLGAPQAGVITADVDGDNTGGFLRRTGAILAEIADRLGIASSAINATSLAALDTAVPYDVNVSITQQISLIDLARAMASPCNAVVGIDLLGRLFVSRAALGTAALRLDAQGREWPPVLGAARENVRPPYKRIMMGAAQSWRVHTLDEVSFYADLIDRGLYSAGATYREGHIVSTIDKARWLWTALAPGSGQAPPAWPTTSNAYWTNLEPPPAYDDGTLVKDLQPAEQGATQGATVPDADGTGGNLKDTSGYGIVPGLVRNDLLELTGDGRFGFLYEAGGLFQELGRASVVDMGGVERSALDQAKRASDKVAEALLKVAATSDRTLAKLRDAGVYVDPETGQVRISTIERTDERVSEAEIRIAAAENSILLRATTTYVDSKIAEAVLDPSQIADLDSINIRLTEAELEIDGLNAAITQKASVVSLTATDARVTTAEQNISALQGQIVTKVENTEFDGLTARVTSAEQTLDALGDAATITTVVSATRAANRKGDDAVQGAFWALIDSDRAKRLQVSATAQAREELGARISSEVGAEASARQSLAARVGAAEAQIVTDRLARIDGDNAISATLSSLSATVGANAAAITQETTARADADEAIASSVSTLSSRVDGNDASITSFAEAIGGLLGRVGLTINVNGYATGYTLFNDGSTGAIVWDVDEFYVGREGEDSERIFSITAEGVRINGNLLVAGSITVGRIQDGAIGKAGAFFDNSTISTGNGIAGLTAASFSITPIAGKPVKIMASLTAGIVASGVGVNIQVFVVRKIAGQEDRIIYTQTGWCEAGRSVPVSPFCFDSSTAGQAATYDILVRTGGVVTTLNVNNRTAYGEEIANVKFDAGGWQIATGSELLTPPSGGEGYTPNNL